MSADKAVVDNVQANRLVVAKVVDVPFIVPVEVALVDTWQDGLVVVATVRAIVDVPNEAGAVGPEVELDSLRVLGILDGNLAKWNGHIKGVVLAKSQLLGRHVRCRRGNGLGVGIVVVDGSDSTRGDSIRESTGERSKTGSHPIGISGLADSFDNNIGTLANAEGDHVGLIWLNRNEVDRHHSQLVAIQAELLDSFGTGVNEA